MMIGIDIIALTKVTFSAYALHEQQIVKSTL